MSTKRRYNEKNSQLLKEVPEFNINNFRDLSEKGTKEQCGICHKWFHKSELSYEYITGYCYECRMNPDNSDIILG